MSLTLMEMKLQKCSDKYFKHYWLFMLIFVHKQRNKRTTEMSWRMNYADFVIVYLTSSLKSENFQVFQKNMIKQYIICDCGMKWIWKKWLIFIQILCIILTLFLLSSRFIADVYDNKEFTNLTPVIKQAQILLLHIFLPVSQIFYHML